ncbi:hypothetical protein QVD17_41340 [Tagetes erecta]|uniref:RNA-directed DNA polymerase, eukaryota, reverse transcriptase zinc-binding domain protein n=1 Tax=Tagetes erecta TaxID=13708 RepID=A0AAD8JWU3_TARER|nr:hypothetical protein QVD17_41340 [Tagetes erecta]
MLVVSIAFCKIIHNKQMSILIMKKHFVFSLIVYVNPSFPPDPLLSTTEFRPSTNPIPPFIRCSSPQPPYSSDNPFHLVNESDATILMGSKLGFDMTGTEEEVKRIIAEELEAGALTVREAAAKVIGNVAPDRRLLIMLKNIKQGIKAWRMAQKRITLSRSQDLKAKIEEWDRLGESRDLSELEKQELILAKSNLFNLELSSIQDLKQKARYRWACDGDENSSYFHKSIKIHIAKSRFNGLMVNNTWIEDPVEIKSLVRNFFMEKFNDEDRQRPKMSNLPLKKLLLHFSNFTHHLFA